MNAHRIVRWSAFLVILLGLVGCGGPDIGQFAGILKKNEDAQLAVIKQTAEKKKPSKGELMSLILLASEGSPDAKVAAREAIVTIGEPAVPVLVASLRTKENWIRMESATLLVRIGQPSVEPLIKATRKRAFESFLLGKLLPGMVSASNRGRVDALKEASLEGRLSAIDALGRIGDPRAVAPLTALAKDQAAELEIRDAAELALSVLQSGRTSTPRGAAAAAAESGNAQNGATGAEEPERVFSRPTNERIAVGDTRAKVERALGKPKGTFINNQLEILVYDHAEFHLKTGVVVYVRY